MGKKTEQLRRKVWNRGPRWRDREGRTFFKCGACEKHTQLPMLSLWRKNNKPLTSFGINLVSQFTLICSECQLTLGGQGDKETALHENPSGTQASQEDASGSSPSSGS